MKRPFLALPWLIYLWVGQPFPQESKAPAAKPSAEAPKVHSEVKLVLKKGDRVKGIVRNNLFCEKVEGRRFLPAAQGEHGTGIRLWYVNGTKSYIYFPQEIFERFEVVRGLTEVELREIAASAEEAASHKKEPAPSEEKKPEDEAPKPQEGKPSPPPRLSEEEVAALARKLAEEEEGRQLLERFPPDAGWGEERYRRIGQGRANDIYPTEEEAGFEKSYEKWKKAFDAAEEKRLREEREKAGGSTPG